MTNKDKQGRGTAQMTEERTEKARKNPGNCDSMKDKQNAPGYTEWAKSRASKAECETTGKTKPAAAKTSPDFDSEDDEDETA